MALFEGLTPDLLVVSRISMLFALPLKLWEVNPHCLDPSCLKGFSEGNPSFALQIPYQTLHSPNASVP